MNTVFVIAMAIAPEQARKQTRSSYSDQRKLLDNFKKVMLGVEFEPDSGKRAAAFRKFSSIQVELVGAMSDIGCEQAMRAHMAGKERRIDRKLNHAVYVFFKIGLEVESRME